MAEAPVEEAIAAAPVEEAAPAEAATAEAPVAEEKPAEEAPATNGEAVAAPLFTAPEGEGDDLTQIKGIGPVAMGQLKEQGVTTFAQIAALSDDDVKRIDEAMPFSADQISDWRSQAAEIAKG